MSRLLFLSLLLPSVVAAEIAFDFFADKPRSLVKDFYISRYLDQNISPRHARALLGEVKNMNWKLFDKFAQKVDDFTFSRISYCRKLQPGQFAGKESDCIKIGLTPYKATRVPPATLIAIAGQIASKYPQDAVIFRLIAKRDFNQSIAAGAQTFLALFNQVGNSYRQEVLNHPLPPSFLTQLAKEPAFNTAITKIVQNPKLTRLQQSILKFDSSALNAQSNFLLGLNALRHGHEEIAIWYFKAAEKKAYFNFDRDKALFWQYLITKERAILQKLITQSKDINLYTLYAWEKLGKFPKNIILSIEPKQPRAPFDIRDPFAWLRVKSDFRSKRFKDQKEKEHAALELNAKESEPHVAQLLYRYQDNLHYYLLAYADYLRALPLKRQALILAIARQESRFIPTEVSYSYALGLMQFMPFVAKAIAREKGIENFPLEAMFDPRTAYDFANTHLDFLEKSLYHPLIVAYAYNAGIGYTRRQILQKETFFTNGAYEPFMSMELLPNAQARKYGKKVLANYVIYAKILGIRDVSLLSLLKSLTYRHRISRF